MKTYGLIQFWFGDVAFGPEMLRSTEGKATAWEKKGMGVFQTIVLWKLGMGFLEEILCMLLS